jgi:N-acetylglutamate synthase-like GNAT family acetyltransferase
VFAHTLQPAFFTTLGYAAVDRALYPEKRARAHTVCLRRDLRAEALPAVAAPVVARGAGQALAAAA